jgi:hypothetical protein
MEAEEPEDRSELQCSASQESAFDLAPYFGKCGLLKHKGHFQFSSWRALRLGSLISVWSLFDALVCTSFGKQVTPIVEAGRQTTSVRTWRRKSPNRFEL